MTEEDKQLSLTRREWLKVIHRSWCHPSSSGVTGVIYRLLELFIGSKEWSIIGFRAIHWLLKWSFVSWSDPSSSGTIYPLLEWSIGSWNDLSAPESIFPLWKSSIVSRNHFTTKNTHSHTRTQLFVVFNGFRPVSRLQHWSGVQCRKDLRKEVRVSVRGMSCCYVRQPHCRETNRRRLWWAKANEL